MSDILTTILARKADEIAERSARVSLADLRARVADAPPTRGFAFGCRPPSPLRPAAASSARSTCPISGASS